jgi:hypothetical protein
MCRAFRFAREMDADVCRGRLSPPPSAPGTGTAYRIPFSVSACCWGAKKPSAPTIAPRVLSYSSPFSPLSGLLHINHYCTFNCTTETREALP